MYVHTSTDIAHCRAHETMIREAEQTAEFYKVLKQLDSMRETPAQKAKRQAEEAEAAQAKRDQNRRINQLLSQIAHARTRAASGDSTASAELSALQTELFWLMFSL